jgi:hypothetical protein
MFPYGYNVDWRCDKDFDRLRVADDDECFVELTPKTIPESKMGPAMNLTMARIYRIRDTCDSDGIGFDHMTICAFDGHAFYGYANNVKRGDTTTLQKITYNMESDPCKWTRTPLLEFILVDPIVRGIFSNDRTKMIAITEHGVAGVFDFSTNTCRPNSSEYGFGNPTTCFLLTAGFAPDGASIVMVFVDCIVFLHIQTGRVQIVAEDHGACDACVSDSGRVIVTRHRQNNTSIFKILTVDEAPINTLAKQLEEIKM